MSRLPIWWERRKPDSYTVFMPNMSGPSCARQRVVYWRSNDANEQSREVVFPFQIQELTAGDWLKRGHVGDACNFELINWI